MKLDVGLERGIEQPFEYCHVGEADDEIPIPDLGNQGVVRFQIRVARDFRLRR
jgi:hypothetical protein